MNNYIITNHAKQRRQHYPVRSDQELQEIMSKLDAFYNFSSLSVSKKAIAVHLTRMIEDADPLPSINLNRCREAAKGHILIMIRPQKELLIIKEQ